MASVRLQKVLARAGIASRRSAEEMITAGRVRVDGHIVTELGTKVDAAESRVEVDGLRIVREKPVYLLLHKPRGVVSTLQDPEGRPSVRELLADVPARVYPVGRLDFNTSGVLLVTNDGEFADGLMHPRGAVPKTYVVKVHGVMKVTDLNRWRRGVNLEDGKTLPAKVKVLRFEGDKTWLELTITEGRNQQIRRMGDATGFRVMRLARTGFAGVSSDGLAPGRWRHMTAEELTRLKKDFGVPRRIVSPPREELPKRPAVAARAVADRRPDARGRSGAPGHRRPPRRDDAIEAGARRDSGAGAGREGEAVRFGTAHGAGLPARSAGARRSSESRAPRSPGRAGGRGRRAG